VVAKLAVKFGSDHLSSRVPGAADLVDAKSVHVRGMDRGQEIGAYNGYHS
jgi:hypothetical protein